MTSRFHMSFVLVGALVTAGCGGSVPATPPATAPLATDTPAIASDVPMEPTAEPTAEPAVDRTAEPEGSFTPGPVSFRVVNLYRDETGETAPVDVYARTQGLVEAFPVVMGLQPGEATDYFAPPDPGKVVITDEGAGDPTCVASCDHFISTSSTNFGQGDARTMIVYDEGTLELWHNPDAGSVGNSGNALAPADPSIALLFVVGVALQDADFGLRLGYATEEGCEVNRTAENILVGGNQVAIFAFDSSAGVVLYDNGDLDCSGEPVGGPFPVSGAAGSRTLLVLFGSPGAMEALTLEI